MALAAPPDSTSSADPRKALVRQILSKLPQLVVGVAGLNPHNSVPAYNALQSYQKAQSDAATAQADQDYKQQLLNLRKQQLNQGIVDVGALTGNSALSGVQAPLADALKARDAFAPTYSVPTPYGNVDLNGSQLATAGLLKPQTPTVPIATPSGTYHMTIDQAISSGYLKAPKEPSILVQTQQGPQAMTVSEAVTGGFITPKQKTYTFSTNLGPVDLSLDQATKAGLLTSAQAADTKRGTLGTPAEMADYAKAHGIPNPILPQANAQGLASWDQFLDLNQKGLGVQQAQTDLAGRYETPAAAQNYINQSGLAAAGFSYQPYVQPNGMVDMKALRTDVESALNSRGQNISNQRAETQARYDDQIAKANALLTEYKLDQVQADMALARQLWDKANVPGQPPPNLTLQQAVDFAAAVAANGPGGKYTLRQVLNMSGFPTSGYTSAQLDAPRTAKDIQGLASAVKAMVDAKDGPGLDTALIIQRLSGAAAAGKPSDTAVAMSYAMGQPAPQSQQVNLGQYRSNPALAPYLQGIGESKNAAGLAGIPKDALGRGPDQLLASAGGSIPDAIAALQRNQGALDPSTYSAWLNWLQSQR